MNTREERRAALVKRLGETGAANARAEAQHALDLKPPVKADRLGESHMRLIETRRAHAEAEWAAEDFAAEPYREDE